MELTDDELDLILAGLFELAITYVEEDAKRERCKALARKGGRRIGGGVLRRSVARIAPAASAPKAIAAGAPARRFAQKWNAVT